MLEKDLIKFYLLKRDRYLKLNITKEYLLNIDDIDELLKLMDKYIKNIIKIYI